MDKMRHKPTSYGRFAVSLALWMLTITIASVLLAAAIVIGLTELMDSAMAALLIGAAIFLLLAAVIYLAGIRTTLCKIEVETRRTMEVFLFFGDLCEWIRKTMSPYLDFLFPKWRA